MFSDLGAHAGTSVPYPMLIYAYHDGQSSLFSRLWEEWCSHLYFPLCISSVLWIKWDHIGWPGDQNNYVYHCFHGQMHLDFHTSSHLYKLSDWRVSGLENTSRDCLASIKALWLPNLPDIDIAWSKQYPLQS